MLLKQARDITNGGDSRRGKRTCSACPFLPKIRKIQGRIGREVTSQSYLKVDYSRKSHL